MKTTLKTILLLTLTFTFYSCAQVLVPNKFSSAVSVGLNSASSARATFLQGDSLTLSIKDSAQKEYANITTTCKNEINQITMNVQNIPTEKELTFKITFTRYDSEEQQNKICTTEQKATLRQDEANTVNLTIDLSKLSADSDTDTKEQPDDLKNLPDDIESYTKYYITNTETNIADGTNADPYSLIQAIQNIESAVGNENYNYALILLGNITIDSTLTIPSHANVWILNESSNSYKISASQKLNANMFSHADYANLTLYNVTVDGNSSATLFCTNNGMEDDGSVSKSGCLTIKNSLITNFVGSDNNAVIDFADAGSLTIINSYFTNNTIGRAGLINVQNGTIYLNNEANTGASNTFTSTKTVAEKTTAASTDETTAEIVIEGSIYLYQTNSFTNDNIYAIKLCGWSNLHLAGTYTSGCNQLKVYSDYNSRSPASQNTIIGTTKDENKITVTGEEGSYTYDSNSD